MKIGQSIIVANELDMIYLEALEAKNNLFELKKAGPNAPGQKLKVGFEKALKDKISILEKAKYSPIKIRRLKYEAKAAEENASDKMVKNPNPDGRQELVKEDSAEQWLKNHGKGPRTIKELREENQKYAAKPKPKTEKKSPAFDSMVLKPRNYVNVK